MKSIGNRPALSLMLLMMTGCATPPTGTYEVIAVNANGEQISPRTIASGSSVYTARNALCITKPGSVVTIRQIGTGEHLANQSPYRCR